MFSPDQYLTSVHAIDLASLRRNGVRVLLIDLDNTLLARDTNVIDSDLRAWAARVAEAGFSVCLVSNNWHERVHAAANELGFRLVSKAVKPLPFAYLRALRLIGAKRREAVMIGDQLFTDVLGARLLGIQTILVEPLSQTDLPHTLMLRRLEAVVLRGRTPSA